MAGVRCSVPRAFARAAVSGPSRPCVQRHVQARAAEEVGVDDDFVMVEEAESVRPETIPDKVAVPKAKYPPLPTYFLNVLYLDKAIGIAVDQRLMSGERGPVTEYFWWPAADAWGDLKARLEEMTWIDSNQVVSLLNVATKVINFWQSSEGRPSLDGARKEFPDVTFYGS